jgi:hypothetical protein
LHVVAPQPQQQSQPQHQLRKLLQQSQPQHQPKKHLLKNQHLQTVWLKLLAKTP